MTATAPVCVVGTKPWFPWPLSRIPWLNNPVPAERLAAIRISLGLLLLFDILTTYLPDARAWFGDDSMGSPELFSWVFSRDSNRGNWSILQDVTDINAIRAVLIVWVIATLFMILGIRTRFSAFVSWVIAISVANVNTYIDNSGDLIRTMVLFYLMLGRSGAAWSVEGWLWRRYRLVFDWPIGWRFERREQPLLEPAYIYPWTLRLIVFQMTWIYFGNGFYKHAGDSWPDGESLYYVLADLELTRVSYAQFTIPYWATRLMTKIVLLWEISFPFLFFFPWKWLADQLDVVQQRIYERLAESSDLLIRFFARLPNQAALSLFLWGVWRLTEDQIEPERKPVAVSLLFLVGFLGWVLLLLIPERHLVSPLRWNREITLAFGFLFHLGIAVQMEIGGFPFYLMCLYAQFIPWERIGRKKEPEPVVVAVAEEKCAE